MDASSLHYEEHLLRDPFSVKAWLSYLLYHAASPPPQRHLIYERALSKLPTSYKLWLQYLRERTSAAVLPPAHAPVVRGGERGVRAGAGAPAPLPQGVGAVTRRGSASSRC